MWHKACKPPVGGEDYGWAVRSRDVLVCNSEGIHTGYAYTDAESGDVSWHMTGPDAYGIEGVTHWRELPARPF